MTVHKGGNSIFQINECIFLNTRSVECDVYLTKNNKLVVGDINKEKLENQENWLPFSSIIDKCNKDDITLFVDIKCRLKSDSLEFKNTAAEIIKELKKYKNKKDIYVMSFNHDIIQKIKSNNSFTHKAGILFNFNDTIAEREILCEVKEKIKSVDTDFIESNRITPQIVQECKNLNQEIISWSAKSINDLSKAKKLNFDYITVDIEILRFLSQALPNRGKKQLWNRRNDQKRSRKKVNPLMQNSLSTML